jgi:hypothetical protein
MNDDISRELQANVRRIVEDERNTEDDNIRERIREQIIKEYSESEEEPEG